jgi:lipopolysaccharide/colanic/teichoic acid biosynthesis glycosyltransferase
MSVTDNTFLSKSELNLLDINTIEQFHLVLKSERFRCDRINKEFSLIVFNIKEDNRILFKTKSFVELIKSKTRNYDAIGWFDENHIALLLPETSIDIAKKVVTKISLAMQPTNKIPDFNIFTYPSQIIENNNNINNTHNIDINHAIADGYVMPLWKRALDIVFSFSALTILSPILLLTAAFIKTVSPGPVFFKQQRIGQSGRIFNLLKLRTMHVNNDDSIHREYLKKLINCEGNSDLPMIKLNDDKRIIMFGKIIRKACIDELPQFINVLRGDMSLVGPRPCIPYEAEEFLHWHKRRFDIVPGITGLWQVSGKNNTTFKEMIRLDIEYSVKRSIFLDLKIIIKTPGVIIGQVFDSINKRIESKSQELSIDSAEVAHN